MTPAVWSELVRMPLRDLGPYVPGASAAEVQASYGMEHLERLNWNEGLFGPLPGVLEAAADGLVDAWKYPEEAYEGLRDALAGWLGVPRAQVLPGHGIQALALTVVAAFVSPGDRVVIPWPTYGLYAPACEAAGAEIVRVGEQGGGSQAGVGLGFDLERIAMAARRTDARLVWICDPNNPTGAQLDADDWAAFLDALPRRCIAVADEAYVDYIAPARRTPRLGDVAAGRRVIVLRTFSKIFALAGLRLGYAIAHEDLVPYLHSVQEPFNVNQAALSAGTAALARPECIDARRGETIAARELLVDRLRAGGLEPLPSATNFVLVSIGGADDAAVADRVARRGIMLRAGSEFNLHGHLRITVAPAPLMERVAAEVLAACHHEQAVA